MALSCLLAIGLGGCMEFGYKQGGGNDDFEAARQSCRSLSADADAYRRCLGQKGWTVSTPGSSQATEGAPAPVDIPASASPPAPEPGKPPPTTATTVVEVSAWWKLGASKADLDAAADLCVARLGAAHRPDPLLRRVTSAFKSCLQEKGWRATGS